MAMAGSHMAVSASKVSTADQDHHPVHGKVLNVFTKNDRKCVRYQDGNRLHTQCQWIGEWADAKVVEHFIKNDEVCSVWQKGTQKRTTCRKRGNFTAQQLKAIYQEVRSGKRAHPISHFTKNDRQCVVYKNAQGKTHTQCKWIGAWANAKVVKHFIKGDEVCSVWNNGTQERTTCRKRGNLTEEQLNKIYQEHHSRFSKQETKETTTSSTTSSSKTIEN